MTKINGNLTADPEVREIGEKKTKVLSFTVAVNNGEDKEGKAREATFVDCSVFGEARINVAGATLKKGAAVELVGELGARAYLPKEGDKPAAVVTLKVAFGDVLAFNGKGVAPTKTKLFPQPEAAEV